MLFENLNLDTYQHKDILELFDKFQGEIHPDVGNFRYAPTGEPYWTVTHAGRKVEAAVAVPAKSYDDMFESYRDFLNNLFGFFDRFRTLYFRTLPDVRTQNDEYILWSRFLISRKRAFQNADFNHNPEREIFVSR